MSFSIEISETAEKDLNSLDKRTCESIIKKLHNTAKNPLHFLERLTGYALYKLRCGDYRVIIRVDTAKTVIQVVMLDRRENIYKRLHRFISK